MPRSFRFTSAFLGRVGHLGPDAPRRGGHGERRRAKHALEPLAERLSARLLESCTWAPPEPTPSVNGSHHSPNASNGTATVSRDDCARSSPASRASSAR
jgi:hypothetical protein